MREIVEMPSDSWRVSGKLPEAVGLPLRVALAPLAVNVSPAGDGGVRVKV